MKDMSSPGDPHDLDLGRTIRDLAAAQKLFNRYTLVRILGRGGMGIVWLARDEKLGREVALKFLPELVVHDLALLDDLKRETNRCLDLTHPHIVRIHDFVDDPHSACISMEYVDGATLSALRVQRPGKVFEVEELAPWVQQTCEALNYAHNRAKTVHRDLKPANLMVNSKGDLKVTDFGIARSLSDSVSMLSIRTSGTLVYMSPQQLDGERANPWDDIYSLGATIYELLASKPPFYSGGIERQIHEKIPPPISARRNELNIASDKAIPAEWEATVAACLAKDPAQRPQSAAEVAKRLGLATPQDGQTGVAPTSPIGTTTPSTATNKAKSTNRKAAIVWLIALGLLGGALGWYFGVYSPREQARKADENRIAAQRSEAEAAERAANARGAVMVNTEPQGATVTLGGETQKSPATFNHAKAGTLPLKITMEGYEPTEQQIDVKEGQISNPGIIKLVRSTGTVQIDTTPQGIDFDLEDADGRHHSGKTPATLAEVPAGQGKITYKPQQSDPHTESVVVTAKQRSELSWKLLIEPETETLSTAPPLPSPSKAPLESPQSSATAQQLRNFAGVWKGQVHFTSIAGLSGIGSHSFSSGKGMIYTIRVSADEKTVLTSYETDTTGYQSRCKRSGNTLNWSFGRSKRKGSLPPFRSTCSLTLKQNDSATFVATVKWLGSQTKPSKQVGTLSR